MTLRERNWRIFSLSGTLETVRGRGVVGHEPVLNQEQPAFQYSSHVSLQAPSGHMWYVLHYLLHKLFIPILLGGPDEVGRWSKKVVFPFVVELVSKELNHLTAILHVYAGGLNFMK